MITLLKVSETTKSKANEFKVKIVEDLVGKIRSHCCMLGISGPWVKTWDDPDTFRFTALDTYVSNINVNDIDIEKIGYLRATERHYLNKVLKIKTQTEVPYEVYLEQETVKYLRNKATQE